MRVDLEHTGGGGGDGDKHVGDSSLESDKTISSTFLECWPVPSA